MSYQMQLGALAPRHPIYPWHLVGKEFQWATIDKNGDAFFFADEPEAFEDDDFNVWLTGPMLPRVVFIEAEFDRGDLPWTETKMKRPSGV